MIRVAFQMLLGDRAKFVGILIGVTFVSLLITQQAAIFDGLISRSHGAIDDVGVADLWVMDPKTQQIDDYKPMTDTTLSRVRSVAGVAWAMPYMRTQIKARLPDGTQQSCVVIGVDDTTLVGAPPIMTKGRLEDLRRADGVIIEAREAADKLATPLPNGKKQPLQIGDTIELNDFRRVVVGLAEPSRTFMWFPMVYTTYSRALQMAPPERRNLTYVLVKVAPGSDRQVVADRIAATTGMTALTQAQFRQRTVDFIMKSTGIPINFRISMALGFLVGCAIAGQTFFNFVHDNLRHLGALKAMGARNRQLVMMVLAQAGLAGFIGYGFGVGAAALFGTLVGGSELAFLLSAERLINAGTAVLFVVLLSSALALRSVIRLEPAVVFRS
jgi:putative ABC transport system permease protein